MHEQILYFQVSGNIVNELSEKIPSYLFALNELIKNSYDAFATEVSICLDSQKKSLVVTDNGNGMTLIQIQNLFCLSKSEKKYGSVLTQETNTKHKISRICQGSKGLGFLSSFKFGSRVLWKTTPRDKSVCYEFSLDKEKIVSLNNLPDYPISILEKTPETSGTQIEIMLDSKSLESLKLLLENDVINQKILGSILDRHFQIKLFIDNKPVHPDGFKAFSYQNSESQICLVSYNSRRKTLRFTTQKETYEEKYDIDSNRFSVNLKLVIFKFLPGKNKKTEGISKFFYREHDDVITPLLFINNSLFNNTSIYDPNVNRSMKNEYSFPQQIGLVNLRCKDDELDFNSDRTNLVETDLSNSIKSELKELNSYIQKRLSTLLQIEKKINHPKCDHQIYQNSKESKTTSSDAKGKHNKQQKFKDPEKITHSIQAARIILKESKLDVIVNSQQLNLLDNIKNATNSYGQSINKGEISVVNEETGEILVGGVLPSQSHVGEFSIIYKYRDAETGMCSECLTIRVIPGTTKTSNKSIFESHPSFRYLYNHSSHLEELINELNRLPHDKFRNVTACSLRSILELSFCDYMVELKTEKKNNSNSERS